MRRGALLFSSFTTQRRWVSHGGSNPRAAMSAALAGAYHEYCKAHNVSHARGVPIDPFAAYVAATLKVPDAAAVIRSDVSFSMTNDVVTIAVRSPERPYYAALKAVARAVPLEGATPAVLQALVEAAVPGFTPEACDCLSMRDALATYPLLWHYVLARGAFVPIGATLATISRASLHPTDPTSWEAFEDLLESRVPGWLSKVTPADVAEASDMAVCTTTKGAPVHGVEWKAVVDAIHDTMPTTGMKKPEFMLALQAKFPSFSVDMLHGDTLRQFLTARFSSLFTIEDSKGTYVVKPKDISGREGFERDVLHVLPSLLERRGLLPHEWVDFEEVTPSLPKGGPTHYNAARWMELLQSSSALEYTVKVVVREKTSRMSRVGVFVDGEKVSAAQAAAVLRRLEVSSANIRRMCVVRKPSSPRHGDDDVIATPWLDTYMAVEAQAASALRKDAAINSAIFICAEGDTALYHSVSSVAVGVSDVKHIIVSTPTVDTKIPK